MKKIKLNIMKTRPHLSDEEIRDYMNFDAVVRKHQALRLGARNRVRVITISALTVGVASLVYFLLMDQRTARQVADPPPSVIPSAKDSLAVEQPSASVEEPKDEPRRTEKNRQQPVAREKKQEKEIVLPTELPPAEADLREAAPVEGYPHLYEYFSEELRYPAEAVRDSIRGTVTVSFIIDKEGRPIDIKILNSLGPAFDNEAHRLVENMPPWKPATVNGKPVPSRLTLPLTFAFGKTENNRP